MAGAFGEEGFPDSGVDALALEGPKAQDDHGLSVQADWGRYVEPYRFRAAWFCYGRGGTLRLALSRYEANRSRFLREPGGSDAANAFEAGLSLQTALAE